MFRQISHAAPVDLLSGEWQGWRLFNMLVDVYPSCKVFSGKCYPTEWTPIELAQTVLIRPRQNRANERRIGILDAKLGSGAFGYVFKLIEYDLDHSGEPVRLHTTRVVKVSREEKLECEREYHLTPRYLSMKPWIDQGNHHFSVMKQMPGQSLDKLLDEAYKIRRLTSYQKISLLIAMTRALREQVHEEGLVHRDVKPANIMVDLSDRDHPVVTLIDFGLSKRINEDDRGGRTGTAYYMAYEAHDRYGTTVLSDVYSLGIVFLEVLGIAVKEVNITEARARSIDYKVPSYFPMMEDVDQCIHDALTILIKEMTRNGISETRCSIKKVEESLQEIRLTMKMREHDLYHKRYHQKRKKIRAAHQYAIRARKRILNVKSAKEYKNILPDYFNKIVNKPLVVKEFVESLGVQAFYTCRTREALRAEFNRIDDTFENAEQQLQACLERMIGFKHAHSGDNGFATGKSADLLDRQMQQVTRKLEKLRQPVSSFDEMIKRVDKAKKILADIRSPIELKIQSNCFATRTKLFQLADLNESLKYRLHRLMESLERNASMFNAGEKLYTDVIELKYQFKAAISQYLQKSVDTYRLRVFNEPFTHTRLNDAEAIVKTINQAKSTEELITAVTKEMNSFETGFFGRSRLREMLRNVIETWNIINKVRPMVH